MDDQITPTSRRNLLIATGLAAALCVSLGVNHFHAKAIEKRNLEIRAVQAEAKSARKDAEAARIAAAAAKLKAEELEIRRLATEALLDSPYYGWAILDSDGLVEEWSPALAAWSGYTREEMVGEDVTKLMLDEKRELHTSGYAQLIADPRSIGKTFIVDCDLVPKDPSKKPIPVRVNARVVELPHGKPYALAFIDRQSRVREVPNGVPQ